MSVRQVTVRLVSVRPGSGRLVQLAIDPVLTDRLVPGLVVSGLPADPQAADRDREVVRREDWKGFPRASPLR